MALVPFISGTGQDTICFDQNHFSQVGTQVLIFEWDADFANRQGEDGNTSYDLRVGSIYRDHRDGVPRSVNPGDDIKILPGMTIIIETKESFHFPACIGGLILSKVSLLQKGLSNPATKVDPGYRGHLLITVVNHGQRLVVLKHGERFCSLQLIRSELPNAIYNKAGKTIGGSSRSTFLRNILDMITANNGIIVTLNIVATLALVVATLVLYIKQS